MVTADAMHTCLLQAGPKSHSAGGHACLLQAGLSAERFLAVTRAHWAIENSLYWVLDVTMNEDRARNRKEKGPENLAMDEASGP